MCHNGMQHVQLWIRARIRKIEANKTEKEEYFIENLRRIAFTQKWLVPYMPGDRPHYSDINGKLININEIEQSKPQSWVWKNDWHVELGDHSDSQGWEYGIGM